MDMSVNDFEIADLPILGYFNRQRFPQFCPEDCANWYLIANPNGKKKLAMYPSMGRKHVNYLGQNRLIFNAQPRAVFKSKIYAYYVVNNTILRVDRFFNIIEISGASLVTFTGNVFFTYLVVNEITFACFVDGQKLYVYREDTGVFSIVTDPRAPTNPSYIVAFANRLVVSQANSAQFFLSVTNLGGLSFDPALCFSFGTGPGYTSLFAQEDYIIGQMAVLNNNLYIFTDITTGIWQNTPSVFSGSGVIFPLKKNSTFSFDFGIASPLSLSVGFDMMAWEAQNSDGLVQFMWSTGQPPKNITSKAVDVLLQNNATLKAANPFLDDEVRGFLYSYENTIFYRVSLGSYVDTDIIDLNSDAFSLDYNFDAEEWARVTELNGQRNKAEKSIYFANRHLITVSGENTVYEMAGIFYANEVRNPAVSDPQAADAYLVKPFRYVRVTPTISEDDYSEFETEYVQIDFVWGDQDFIKNIVEDETTYDTLLKPSITLYWSDDGGISFYSADNREFSALGEYSWRMRWYQLGCSRNRVYKLVCVSTAPIVILGGVMNKRRISGGAN